MAFRCACNNCNLEMAKWLHSLGIISVDVCTKCLTNITEYRCESSNLDILQWLLEYGADIHVDDNIHLKRFLLWKNKIVMHKILLQYCQEEDYYLLDEDILKQLSNGTKSARKV